LSAVKDLHFLKRVGCAEREEGEGLHGREGDVALFIYQKGGRPEGRDFHSFEGKKRSLTSLL